MSAPRGSVVAQCVLSDILRYWHTLEAMARSQKNICATLNSHILDYTQHELRNIWEKDQLFTFKKCFKLYILIYKPEWHPNPSKGWCPRMMSFSFTAENVVNKTLEDHPNLENWPQKCMETIGVARNEPPTSNQARLWQISTTSA